MNPAAAGLHLARRFVTSLWPGPPRLDDERWATDHLGEGERGIWRQMSNPDRRHAIGVARAVVAELGPDTGREVVAAALLHDSGKIRSGFGTFARVGATVVWLVVPNERAEVWISDGGPLRARLGRYRRHPELGGEMLAAAGSDPLTVAWAAEHHRDPATWTVPADIGIVLKACDDD